MIKSFFTNLENIVISELMRTRESVTAAIAWINFEIYGEIFDQLLNRKVKINILLNNDQNNQRYISQIQYLNSRGADIALVSFAGIMHHKFCVIDNRICLFGSFNWTRSANIRNIEDLNICDDFQVIKNYLLEFDALLNLSKEDVRQLAHPLYCDNCRNPIINILFMSQEDDYKTKIEIKRHCECGFKIIYTNYYDISVYINYIETIRQFDDDIYCLYQSGDDVEYHKMVAQQDFIIANYLSSFARTQRMGIPIIHAVGVNDWKWFDKRNGMFVYKIIWKERGTELYVQDEYDVDW